MAICNAKDFPEMPPAKSSPEMLEPFTRVLTPVTEMGVAKHEDSFSSSTCRDSTGVQGKVAVFLSDTKQPSSTNGLQESESAGSFLPWALKSLHEAHGMWQPYGNVGVISIQGEMPWIEVQ